MSHPQESFNSGPLAQDFVSESRNRNLSENAFPEKMVRDGSDWLEVGGAMC